MWDVPRLVALVAQGTLPVERVVTSEIDIHDAVKRGFEPLVAGGSGEVKVLIDVAGRR